jgi:hypothetical protein
MSIPTWKRKLKVKAARIAKGVRYGVWSMRAPKNPQERLILRIVKNMLEKDDSIVFYSPEVGRIYVHTKDKKYIVVFDRYSVNISNHNYFYTYGITEVLGNDIINSAFRRLERDRAKLENEMFFNEKNFLNDVYSHVTKKSSRGEKSNY